MNINNTRVCQTCVMDSSDPNICFFEDGTCSHCRHATRFASHSSSKRYPLDKLVTWMRQLSASTSDCKYDCIVGLSGGVDSSWLLHLLVPTGLKIYVHHVDTGWNTAKAVANVYRICDVLGQELHTHVIDWNLFRKIQQAYFYLGVLNQDVPQDIAIFSSQIMACKDNSISCLVSGANNTTESILPSAWGHHWHDLANLEAIYSCFGTKSFPNSLIQPMNCWLHIDCHTFQYAAFIPLTCLTLLVIKSPMHFSRSKSDIHTRNTPTSTESPPGHSIIKLSTCLMCIISISAEHI